MKKKDYKKLIAQRVKPSVAYDIAEEIARRTDREVRVAVPGHTQRVARFSQIPVTVPLQPVRRRRRAAASRASTAT